jgi:hypothetical protein
MARIAIADVFAGLVTAVKDAQRVLAERHVLHLSDYFDSVTPLKSDSAATTRPDGDSPLTSSGPPAMKPKMLRFLVPMRDKQGNTQHHELAVPLASIAQLPELQIKTVDVEFEARLDAPAIPANTGRQSPLADHLMGELDRLADQQQLGSKLQLEMKGSMFSSSMPLAKIKVTLEVREQNEALSRLTDHYLKNL